MNHRRIVSGHLNPHRSIHWYSIKIDFWWALLGSNQGPKNYEFSALTS